MNANELLTLLRLLARFSETDWAKALASDCISDTYEAVEMVAKSLGFTSEELFRLVDQYTPCEAFVISEEGFTEETVELVLANLR